MSRRIPSPLAIVRRFPMTVGLVSVVFGMFLCELYLGGATSSDVLIRLGSLRSDRVVNNGEYYRLGMAMWLHAGWVHLIFNLLALIQLSALVESIWGSMRTMAYYLVCGWFAALISAWWNPVFAGGSVGASGAILGLAGVLIGTQLYGEQPLRIWLDELLGRRLISSVNILILFGLLAGSLVGLDNAAHIGGLFLGLVIAASQPHPNEEWGHEAIAAMMMGMASVGCLLWMVNTPPLSSEELASDRARHLTAEISRFRSGPDWYTRLTCVDAGELLMAERSRALVEAYATAKELQWGQAALNRVVSRMNNRHALEAATGQLLASSVKDLAMVPAERLMKRFPEDPSALNTLAWTRLETQTEPLLAVSEAKRALSLLDEKGWQTSCSLEEWDDAEIQEKTLRAAILDTLGEAHSQAGELDRALEVQRRAVDLVGDDESVLSVEIRERLKRFEAAK